MNPKRVWERVLDLARASPGEVGLVGLLIALVLGASFFVVSNTWRQTPPPPIKRVVTAQEAAPIKMIVVHVAGMVASPGVYELPDGSRVKDAIEAAGGAVEGADLDALNLAALISDGEKIFVPKPGETIAANEAGSSQGRININSASQAQLEELPGIGPVIAARIVEYRQQHGPFKSIKQLMEVQGIGAKTFEALRDFITV